MVASRNLQVNKQADIIQQGEPTQAHTPPSQNY